MTFGIPSCRRLAVKSLSANGFTGLHRPFDAAQTNLPRLTCSSDPQSAAECMTLSMDQRI